MQFALQVEGLVKRFGDFAAVDGVSFSVAPGEVFGLLGPNGAGKTTTLEMAEGLQSPTAGRICVLGLELPQHAKAVKSRIGVQLQASSYYEYLNLAEILGLLGRFYPRRLPPGELLERVGLADQARARIRTLSGGERQRFALAAALVNNPELVILDEPTAGLDPQSRREVWELIAARRDDGAAVVLTTHYMEEAETFCDRLAIIHQGKLRAAGTPRGLMAELQASYTVRVELQTAPPDAAALFGPELHPSGGGGDDNGRTFLLRLDGRPEALPAALQRISESGLGLERLEITPVTLEDVYLHWTGGRPIHPAATAAAPPPTPRRGRPAESRSRNRRRPAESRQRAAHLRPPEGWR